MGEIKMEAFRKSLEAGRLERCYILHGQERYLREQYTRKLRRVVLGQEDDPFNLRQYEGKELDLDELSEAVDAYPSFAERTLVEVRDYDIFHCGEEQTKRLISLLRDLPEYCCLVFLYDTLDYKPDNRKRSLCDAVKNCAVSVDFPTQGQGELSRWVIKRFADNHKEIGREDAAYLIFLCGNLMEGLLNEIGKLSVYAKDGVVTREDIDAVAVPVVEAQVFRLTAALSAKHYDQAAELMYKLFQLNTEPIAINAMIGSQLRRLYTARLVKEAGGGSEKLSQILKGEKDYTCQQCMRICGNFSKTWYRRNLRRCAELDYRLKSSSGDAEEMLKSLFLQLAGESGE